MRITLIAAMALAFAPGALWAAGDSGAKPPRKIPGIHKTGDITLKRGLMSAESASELLAALKPLKERTDTRAMRTAEAQYTEDMRAWAVKQGKRLQELQRIRARYDRLKSYRDDAAARGEDTARIDPRLKRMEGKMETLSGEIRQADQDLRTLQQGLQSSMKSVSNATTARHRQADDYLAKLGS